MKQKPFAENLSESFYRDIYALGDGYRRIFSAVLRFLAKGIGKLFSQIALLLVSLFTFLYRLLLRYGKRIFAEGKTFFSEGKRALPKLKSAFAQKRSLGVKLFFHYVRRSFVSHSRFNRAVVSTVLPLLACVLLALVGGAMKSIVFAVNVTVNGQEVGTVRTESDYKQAAREAQKHFDAVGSDLAVAVPHYQITLTTLDQIDDTVTVCNRIIAAVSEQTVNACGIYINGDFLCAVKSEDTFLRVSNQVLQEYASEHELTSSACRVEFADDITTLSGLYPDDDTIWTAEELYQYLTGDKTEAIEHIVSETETLDDILKQYNLTQAQLMELNESLDTDNIPAGSTLLIKKAEKNLSIKSTVTYIQIETTPFSTVSQYDNNLYIGTTMTIVAGVPGRDVVSYTDTYIDGELTESSHELVRYKANNPVNELLKIGTKGIPTDNNSIPVSPRLYRDQGGTFVWPAPDNCFWLSQGYNPANSHYGIDICSSDSGSSRGRRIVAVADGVVTMATYHYSWGYYIRIDHGSGVVTGYAHALEGSFRVNVGDYVKAGQQISSIGTTGNSSGYPLHFEVWLDGVRVNPLPYVYSEYTGVAVK